MYGYNQMFPVGLNPYLNTLQSNQPNGTQLVRVNGIDGAKAYQLQPNSMAALFHENEDIFYIKTTDGAGFPTIKTYKFVEAEPETPIQSGEYATKSELNALRKELVEYAQQFIQAANTDKPKLQNDTSDD